MLHANYNYFRDYDPATGRYVESDPVGLVAGVNTYSYVKNRPLSRIDKRGLTGAEVSGSGINETLQDLPDKLCDIWPARCIKNAIVCTRATCTYKDCRGKPYIVERISFLPTSPNREEFEKESPNCKCTKWTFADGE